MNSQIGDNVSFVILCPELNVGGLRSTVSSIKSYFPKATYMCMVGDNANAKDMREIEQMTPVFQGGKTITSLINVGVKHSIKEWNYVVVAGIMLRPTIFRKYQIFLTGDTDVLYQVVSKATYTFDEATINGILINKKAIREVGDFPDEDSIVRSKLLWGYMAQEKGFKLKGLVGVKL